MNYTGLNWACPKDVYPFPNIDWLVDGATRHKILSFLDACLGYIQIRMDPTNEDKTPFIIELAKY